jgi:transposase, IS30 family
MRKYRRWTDEEIAEVWERWGAGESQMVIALALGRHQSSVTRCVLGHTGGIRPAQPVVSPLRLSLAEREEISRGLAADRSLRAIARGLDRSPSTVSREVARMGGRADYRALAAHRDAQRCAGRPKPAKLATCRRLRSEVEAGLTNCWSPRQIASSLRRRFPDDPEMRVSAETIYQSLYIQGRGALRAELTRSLRTGRAIRRPQGRSSTTRGQMRDMVMISERPAEVEDRAVPGHWEGDLIIGKMNRSAIGTLVERQTRYVMLVHLPGRRDAVTMSDALAATIARLPRHLVASLTWDQGKEMANHVAFTVATGVPVYFCDPHAPWQRGTNENTNGLLRQFFPKGTDLSVHTPEDLERVAHLLNTRPRETLGWETPAEKLAELLR